MTDRIRIKQYEQAADEKVSIGGIKWQRKWDVCIQCDSREEAEAFRARLAQPNQFNPDWDAVAVMVEEQQRMAKELKAQREWQGLTDEEIMDACSAVWASHPIEVGRVVEEKLKEKNNDS